jgi:hypothetical protein
VETWGIELILASPQRADTFLLKYQRPAALPLASSAAIPTTTTATAAAVPCLQAPSSALDYQSIPAKEVPRELKLPAAHQLLAQFAQQLDVAIRWVV